MVGKVYTVHVYDAPPGSPWFDGEEFEGDVAYAKWRLLDALNRRDGRPEPVEILLVGPGLCIRRSLQSMRSLLMIGLDPLGPSADRYGSL